MAGKKMVSRYHCSHRIPPHSTQHKERNLEMGFFLGLQMQTFIENFAHKSGQKVLKMRKILIEKGQMLRKMKPIHKCFSIFVQI